MKMMVVTPDWVVDSVRHGVRRNEEEYDPSLFEVVSVQEASADKDITSNSNTAEEDAKEKTSTSLVVKVDDADGPEV